MNARVVGQLVERLLPVVVLLVAAFLRFYRLSTVPTGLLWDEAFNGIDTLRVLAGAHPLFFSGNFGREALFIYLQAISVALFGQTDLSLRLVSAFVGTLTVPAAYLFIRRIFGRRVAILTCAWLAISLWHLLLSRIGLRPILLPLVSSLTFYCFWRGLEPVFQYDLGCSAGRAGSVSRPSSIRAFWLALAGLGLGTTLWVYTTARFLPILVVVFVAYLATIRRAHAGELFLALVIVGTVSLIVFLPEGYYFFRHPDDFFYRARATSAVLNPNGLKESAVGIVIDTTLKTLGMFNLSGDQNWAWNIAGRPIFDPLSSLMMLLGLGLVLRDLKAPRNVLVLLWIVILLVPNSLTSGEAPKDLRAVGLIPIIFVLPALGAAGLWSVGEIMLTKRLGATTAILVGTGFLVGAAVTYHDYFDTWAHAPDVSSLFNSDRWAAVQAARQLAPSSDRPMYVAAGDPDQPLQQFGLQARNQASGVWLFDGIRSLIFPPANQATTYLFADRDLPPAPILERYFGPSPGRVIARTPGGQQVAKYTLFVPRPTYEPEFPVSARFGQQVEVLGYDLPRDVRAGENLTVRWYWKILTPDSRELAFFNQIYDDTGQRRGQLDDRAFAPAYWPVGTSGVSSFAVPVDPAAPTGAYTLLVGIYVRQDLTRLPVVDGLGRVAGGEIRLGPVKVHGAPRPVPVVPQPQPVRFADSIEFLGYDLGPSPALSGASLHLTLFWSARARPSAGYTVFVHLLDARGQLVGQVDSPPEAGRYPTSVWDRDEVIADPRDLAVAPGLMPGAYRLEIGLYQPMTGQRLPIVDTTGKVTADHVVLSSDVAIH